MRTTTIVNKSDSDSTVDKIKSTKEYTKEEIDRLVIRLAEAHGML